jgi:transcriptional regulator with XRE-family HTH domain
MPDHDAYQAALLESLGGLIREGRVERAWTQRDLADAAGVHVNVVGAVERGRSAMRLSTLVMIAGALRTTSADLLRESDARAQRAVGDAES